MMMAQNIQLCSKLYPHVGPDNTLGNTRYVPLTYAEYQWMQEDRYAGDMSYENEDYHDVFWALWYTSLDAVAGCV
jgi:hypothetical protein